MTKKTNLGVQMRLQFPQQRWQRSTKFQVSVCGTGIAPDLANWYAALYPAGSEIDRDSPLLVNESTDFQRLI